MSDSTATRSRFDPEPGKPYAVCNGFEDEPCGLELATEEELRAHHAATMKPNVVDRDAKIAGLEMTWGEYLDKGGSTGGRSHSATLTNRSRAERIRSAILMDVSSAIDDAITDVIDSAWQYHKRDGVTIEELTEAMVYAGTDVDFSEAWREYVESDD